MPELDEAVHRHLANQIRQRAKKREVDLKTLAATAGLSEAGLHRILAGERSPRLQTLCALAAALACRPRDLLP